MNALYEVRLSKHFWAREFQCKGEAEGLPCACHGAVRVDRRLVDVLEVFRPLYGLPLVVTSGFRCDPYNAAVGGHEKSFHRYGMAADITNWSMRKRLEEAAHALGGIVEDVLGQGNGNVLWYPDRGFIHVDVGHRVAQDLVRPMGGGG